MSERRRGRVCRSWTWFLAFQLAALVPVLVVGLALARQYEQQRTQETLREGSTQAALLADVAVGPALPVGDLSAAAPQAAQLALGMVLARPAVRGQVLRLKVWDRTGRVVASDDPRLSGARFPLEDDVTGALAGRTHAEVTRLRSAENVDERQFGTALEVYVPLRDHPGGSTVGALEIYLPYGPLAAQLRQQERMLVTHLALGMAALVVALGVLTNALTSRLRTRTRLAEHLADHDALTGLLSRSAFSRRLEAALQERRPAGGALAVALVDLDDFGRINVALGQDGGDRLLQQVAALLGAGCPGAAVARTGGDEFAVLLSGVGSELDAEIELVRLRDALAVELDVAGVPVTVSASLGAALAPADDVSATTLMQRAGTAVATAKATSHGTATYTPRLDAFTTAQLQLLADLRRPVPAGQLFLQYQPQVCAHSHRVESVEALVRWQHPQLGPQPPAVFLPLAERTGLVLQITHWVLDTAAAQVAEWASRGLDLVCSVNVSARDLADPALVSTVLAATSRHGVDPSRLRLELTETAILEDPVRARQVLTELAGAGFPISLDDFGVGYTSLGQLRDLPVSEVKLDRSFVAGMATHDADRVIVEAVAQLAHSLGLLVVAEGVETGEQAAALRGYGYDLLQGWHLGRPADPASLAAVVPDPQQTA